MSYTRRVPHGYSFCLISRFRALSKFELSLVVRGFCLDVIRDLHNLAKFPSSMVLARSTSVFYFASHLFYNQIGRYIVWTVNNCLD